VWSPLFALAGGLNEQPPVFAQSEVPLANAGIALATIIAAMSAATKSAGIVRLINMPPPFSSVAAVIFVSCCPMIFLLLVEGAG